MSHRKSDLIIENVIGSWRGIVVDVKLIIFLSCAQLDGGTHSYWTEIWKYIPKGDESHRELSQL